MNKLKIPLRREKLLRAGAVFVLLAAVMPNVMYLGHGPTAPAHAHGAESSTDNQPGDDHVQHCHVGAAKCAGPQSLVGTWWADDGPTIPEPPLMREDLDSPHIFAIESEPLKSLRPPRSVLPL